MKKYSLIFETPKGRVVYTTNSLSDDALDKAIKLKGDVPKKFIINQEKTRGRMYYGIMKHWEFDIKKIKGE